MLNLSLRRGDSTIFFGTPRWTDETGRELTATQVAARLGGKTCCLLLHGYNVEDPTNAYNLIEAAIGDLYDEVIRGRWPGSREWFGFWLARRRAAKAGQLLAGALDSLAPASLDIEGHSLGCRVALEAGLHGLHPRNLILAAPAVDDESIQVGEQYSLAVQRAERVLVAYSSHDKVLAGAYRVGSLDNALGLRGPQDRGGCQLNVSSVDCSATAMGHSAYKDDPTFLKAWRDLVT